MSDHRAPVDRDSRLRSRGLLALAALALAGLGFIVSPGLAVAVEDSEMVDVDDFVIGNTMDLYEICSVPEGQPYYSEATLLCIGYFSGAIDYHQAVVGPKFPPIVCAPEGTTRRQVIDNFVAWAQANQANGDLMQSEPIIGAVMSAMEAWPCPAAQ